MMFHRVKRSEFYAHVRKLRDATRRCGHMFTRNDHDSRAGRQRVSYNVNGIPNAQIVMPEHSATACYYVVK